MISAASFNGSDVFIYSDAKHSYGAAHVLFIARACDEIHYIASGTCGEVSHLVDGRGNRRLEGLKFFLPTEAVCAYNALFAGVKTLSLWEKRWLCRGFNNIMRNAIS